MVPPIAIVVIVIVGAAACTATMAAIGNMFGWSSSPDDIDRFRPAGEQMSYMRMVQERNIQGLLIMGRRYSGRSHTKTVDTESVR